MEETTDAERELRLRFAGTCTVCGDALPKGSRAVYSPASRSVRHSVCPEIDNSNATDHGDATDLSDGIEHGEAIDHGAAGASARREYERRKARDDARIEQQKANVRATFGDGFLGKVATFLAVDDSPRRSTSVWAQGAVGEEVVAAQLDALAEVGVIALHDRRIPGTRANIDHIAVTPWGVWVVDAKRHLNKRPDLVTEGGFLGIGGTDRLTVGGRKQDKLIEGMHWQIEKVQAALAQAELGDAPAVRGILCFVDADWPLIGGHFTVRGVRVVWPRRLPKELLQTVPPTVDTPAVARALASAFPPA